MSTKERRKFMRITTDMQAEYWAKGPSMATGQGQVRDFSREGIGMMFTKPVGKGEHVDLTFKVPGDNIPVFATAEVSWTGPFQDQQQAGFSAGLRILSIKPLDLARLLDFVYSRWLGGVRNSL